METLKRNWLKAIAALTLVLGVIFAVNAFENKADVKQNPVKSLKTVYFIPHSNLDTDIQDQGNWSDSPTPGEQCEGVDYLCKVEYDETMYPTLALFLTANNTRSLIEQNAETVLYKDQN